MVLVDMRGRPVGEVRGSVGLGLRDGEMKAVSYLFCLAGRRGGMLMGHRFLEQCRRRM